MHVEERTIRTQRVLQNHLMTFKKGEIDGLMSDFASDAVLITPEGLVRGKAAIRRVFAALLNDLPPGSTIEVTKRVIKDDLAYLLWHGESDKVKVSFATDTILVQNGKIVKQTFAATFNRKE